MINVKSLVFDKVSKREGTVVDIIGKDLCLIETIGKERFTQKVQVLMPIAKLTEKKT